MATTLRLVRLGRRHRPFYRLRAADSRFAPTGRFLEELGTVDPIEKSTDKQIVLKRDRIEYWLSVGATSSATVRTLLEKQGLSVPTRSSKKGNKKKSAS